MYYIGKGLVTIGICGAGCFYMWLFKDAPEHLWYPRELGIVTGIFLFFLWG